MSTEEEPILSAELLGGVEYGAPTDLLVLPANTTQRQLEKKAKKRQRDALPAEEVKEEVKKLSKKKQKRLDQILKRKEREAKASEYLSTIKENEMSAADQQLLTSSKALNHTLSVRETLSLLLRKEKAGLALSEEETALLYVKKDRSAHSGSAHAAEEDFPEELFLAQHYREAEDVPQERDEAVDAAQSKKKKQKPSHTEENESKSAPPSTSYSAISTSAASLSAVDNKAAEIAAPAVVVSLDDLFAPQPSQKKKDDGDASNSNKKKAQSTAANDDNGEDNHTAPESAPVPVPEESVGETKKEKKKNSTEAKETAKTESASKSVGSNLLSQLMQLKGGKKMEQKAAPPVDSDNNGGEEHAMEVSHDEPREEEDNDTEKEDNITSSGVYKADEIALPVNDLGVVHRSAEAIAAAAAATLTRKSVIAVRRPAKVVSERINLPVCRMEQEIVEAINNNDVIILCGETGSGKSTQVPQFLYEAGYAEDGLIGIAQPRRVAVTSTADRVNYEMGEEEDKDKATKKNKKSKKNDERDGRLVGYQIRYDASTVGRRTKIKFLTDGILLREITSDILLRSYRVVILDEAHERNVNTDILLGMLSRAIPLRKRIAEQEMKKWMKLTPQQREGFAPPLQPLKLVVMSATIRVQDFQTPVLFPSPPPLIHVEARQFPVVSHFAKRTELQHYLKETHKKVCQIHRRLPPGGILVFLTGKREILYMCSKLQQSLRVRNHAQTTEDEANNEGAEGEALEDAGMDDLEEGDDFKKYSSFGDRDQAEIDSDEDVDSEGEGSIDGDDAEFSDDEEFVREMQAPSVSDAAASTNKEEENTTRKDEPEESGQSVADRMLAEILGLGAPPADNFTAEEATATPKDHQAPTQTPDASNAEVIDSSALPTSSPADENAMPALKPLIRPLYAMMPAHLQAKVFAPVPPGYRLIVVATNVAETSITIPGITYVVDCGRCKEKVMSAGASSGAGIAKYEIKWISKASADQRQGRAGRTGPGHCYRLYSSNFYHEHMRPFLPPEISATPLEDVVLQMKALGIREIESFPFPTLPPSSSLHAALRLLTNLGAVVESSRDQSSSALAKLDDMIKEHTNGNNASKSTDLSSLSEVGTLMAKFPLHPRFAKMLIVAARYTSLPKAQIATFMGYVLTLVATMAERSVFMVDEAISSKNELRDEDSADERDSDDEADDDDEEKRKQRHMQLFYHPNGDAMARLRATGAFVYSVLSECKKSRREREAAKKAKEDEDDDMDDDDDGEQSRHNAFSRKELQQHSTSEDIQQLCSSNYLHLPSLQRVLDLRMQLQSISESLFPLLQRSEDSFSSNQSIAGELNPPLSPPSPAEEIALRQVLLSGYCDSIARKAPIGMVKEGTRRHRLTAYFSCNPAITEPLYIHPQSNLYLSDPTAALPEFVVYGSLLRNQRGDTLYMTNVTVVSSTWISSVARDCPLLSWGAPLASPTPLYDPAADCIMCHVVPRFGGRQWELPAVKRPLRECTQQDPVSGNNTSKPLGHRVEDEPYRWFARYLLEGTVGLQLKGALSKDKLSEPTSVITQNKVHPKISALLRALVKNEICSRQSLLNKVKANPSILSEEIQNILKPEHRKAFRMAWAQLSKM